MSGKVEPNLEDGIRIANRFLERATPITDMKSYEIAGSIRRHRPTVHDVDVVFRPLTRREIVARELKDLCNQMPDVQIVKWGAKLSSIVYCGVPFDFYFSTPETFATLLLIRTGSKENNIRLCSIAKSRGWKLHASGEGLFNEKGERVAGDSEDSIYKALGLPYQEAWERE